MSIFDERYIHKGTLPTPTDWDEAYKSLNKTDPLPQLDPEFDKLLELAVVTACVLVIGGIALWGILR